ncbi:Dynein heavy chain 5, axonemal [Coelomomyces lativittatus]|nr:Dynein heavy chain 5, axonemal [Coelomomyces lativittatus]
MTSLFVKITNQMITSCKEYIYKDGGAKLWEQDRPVLLAKLDHCIQLNEAYQRYFHETKKRLQETPNEKQFDFSEMYIFGKFDAFCKRIQKVVDMFSVIEKFSKLEGLGVEGMENIIKRFSNIVTQMQRKPYDILDHRKMEYDSDYNSFKKQISDLEDDLQQFIDNSFDRLSNTEQSLILLEKFSEIKDLQLDLDSKYLSVFQNYTRRDLEGIRKLYQKCKATPNIPRNFPPVAGAIAWARQLYRRIERPMIFFKEKTNVLYISEAKKHVKNFNRLGRTLLEYEIMYHQAWLNNIDAARTGLQSTLLVSDESGHLYVNFDPQILQLMYEGKTMIRMGLDVPESIHSLVCKKLYYKEIYMALSAILQGQKRILDKIPTVLKDASAPHLRALDKTLSPGLISLTWSSLNLESYIQHCKAQISKLEELIDKVLDISSCRINVGLHKIGEMQLFQF